MSLKLENEITVKVVGSSEKLIKDLEKNGFVEAGTFTMYDHYMVSSELNISQFSSREILSKAVILRKIENRYGDQKKKIVFKKKDIDSKGVILNQESYSCTIKKISEGINLFKQLGYFEIMKIKENDIIMSKNNIELAIKFVNDLGVLIEFETSEAYQTVDELIKVINDLEIDIDKSNYFVKKAELVLDKCLKRETKIN